jgi:hypothetical protein
VRGFGRGGAGLVYVRERYWNISKETTIVGIDKNRDRALTTIDHSEYGDTQAMVSVGFLTIQKNYGNIERYL